MKKNNLSSLNVVAILLTVLLLILSWKLIAPSYSSNSKALKSLETEITNAQAKLDSLDKTRNDLSSIESTYDMISVAVPDGSDEPNLITELEAIAIKSGIVLPSISISSNNLENANYGSEGTVSIESGIPIDISLSVTGNFDQLNEFVSALEKSVKFLNITDLNYAFFEESGLSLSLNIKAYSRANRSEESANGSLNGVYSSNGKPL